MDGVDVYWLNLETVNARIQSCLSELVLRVAREAANERLLSHTMVKQESFDRTSTFRSITLGHTEVEYDKFVDGLRVKDSSLDTFNRLVAIHTELTLNIEVLEQTLYCNDIR